MRYCMMPASTLRPITPAAFSTATPTISSAAVTSVPVVVRPSRKAGRTAFSVAQPSAHEEPTVMTP